LVRAFASKLGKKFAPQTAKAPSATQKQAQAVPNNATVKTTIATDRSTTGRLALMGNPATTVFVEHLSRDAQTARVSYLRIWRSIRPLRDVRDFIAERACVWPAKAKIAARPPAKNAKPPKIFALRAGISA